jgi:hypothetical protein
MSEERVVRVVHLTGNTGWGGPSARIKPYKLKPGERLVSSNYWRASGNHEQLDLVIEGPVPSTRQLAEEADAD